MSILKVGDPVLLSFNTPGRKEGVTPGLEAYKDRRFRISKIKLVAPGSGSPWYRGIYYELDGCVSDKGVPYSITEDWIEPIRELRR